MSHHGKEFIVDVGIRVDQRKVESWDVPPTDVSGPKLGRLGIRTDIALWFVVKGAAAPGQRVVGTRLFDRGASRFGNVKKG